MGRKLKGIAAAPGIAIAPVVHFHTTLDQIPTRKVEQDQLAAEKGRLSGAIEAVTQSLTDLQKELAGAVGRQDVRIYDAQLAILHDQTFIKEVEGEIEEHNCNLEVALQRVVARYESVFEQMENAAMRERAADLRDIGRQLVGALVASGRQKYTADGADYMFAADEFLPSDAGILVTALGAVQLFVPAAAEALAATHVPAQLAVTVGVVLFALGTSQRKVGKMQQRMDQLEQQRDARDEQLQAAMEDLLHHTSHDDNRAVDGPELQQALLALQRQDQKINNLTKATKMYGKPLMEIAAQCAELVGGLGQLRDQVERSASSSRDVDLGDVPAQLAALAKATSTLRTEASAERAELKAALEQGGDDQLQVRLAEATTRIGDGIDQLRTQELSGLERTLREVQREVSGLATSVAQLQASARAGDPSPSRPAAATATPAPAPAQPTTADTSPTNSSGYSTGARKSGGKNVLGAIAKLKQMKG